MSQDNAGWNDWPARPAYLQWIDASGNQQQFFFDLVQSEEWGEDATVTTHPVEIGADVADHVRVELRTCELKVWSTNEPIDQNNFDQAHLTAETLNIGAPNWEPGSGELIVSTWNNPIELRSMLGLAGGVVGNLVGSALGGRNTGQAVGDIAAIASIEAADLALPATAGETVVPTNAGLLPPVPTTKDVQVQEWPSSGQGNDYVGATILALQTLKNTAQQLTVFGTKSLCQPMVINKLGYSRSSDTGTGADITIGFTEVRTVATQTVAVPIPNLSAGGARPPTNKGAQNPASASTQQQTETATQLTSLTKNAVRTGSLLGVPIL